MRVFAGLLLVAGCDQAFGLTIATDARVSDDARDAHPPGDAVPMKDVVAHYPMDAIGISPCLTDVTGNGNDGTCIGPPKVIATGQIQNAFAFDGKTRIQIPTTNGIAGPGAFTFAGWIEYDGPVFATGCPFNRIFGTDGADSWQVCLDPGGVFFYFTDTTGETDAAPLFTAGVWHHVAIVSTGTEVLTYIDGSMLSDQPWTLAFDGGPIEIGADVDPGPNSSPFTGVLDDIWIFGRALSQTEILALETP